jgi:hypothetical protein
LSSASGIAAHAGIAVRDQPPADQRHESRPGCRGHRAHRGEVEHRERRAQRVLAEGGDDDVGRRADQRDHTAQYGRETERHEAEAGLRPALRAVAMSTGIRSASAATLFMKADRTPPTPPMIAIWAPSAAGGVHQRARDQQHRARAHQPGRDHEDERHDHHRRMAEAREGGLGRDKPQHHGQQQRAEGHHVVAEPPPEQEAEHAPEQGKEKHLVLRHGPTVGRCRVL